MSESGPGGRNKTGHGPGVVNRRSGAAVRGSAGSTGGVAGGWGDEAEGVDQVGIRVRQATGVTGVPAHIRHVTYLALLAMMLSTITLLISTWLAPAARADIPTIRGAIGGGYSELVTENISELCLGQEDDGRGSGSGSDDDDDDSSSSSGCDETSVELWEAAEECAEWDGDAPPATLEDIDTADERDFMACMAQEGFGEEEEEEEEPLDDAIAPLTLGRVSSSLTAFYVNELSPAAGGGSAIDDDDDDEAAESEPTVGLTAWAPILSHPGQAGAFVGALDRSRDESNQWLFGPGNAHNTAEVKYSSFSRNITGGGLLGTGGGAGQAGSATNASGPVPDAGVEAYLTYGALLNGLGLDTTAQREEGVRGVLSSSGMRGYAMLVAFMAAGAVDTFFETVLEALQWLNPFRFMVEAVAENTSDRATSGMAGEPNEQDGLFADLRAMFSQIYSALVSIGWMIVVPLLLVTLLLGMTMMRSAQTGSKAKKLVIIVAFMALGLPLLGTMYTAGLTAMAGATADSARANSTRVVLSTLVDFESWVSESRLAPTQSMNRENFGWNSVDNVPIGQSEAMVRKFSEEINLRNNPAFAPLAPVGPQMSEVGAARENDTSWGTSVISNKASDDDPGSGVGLSVETFNATRDLIMRYANGTNVTASSFESEVKAAFNQALLADQSGQAAPTITGWFDELSDPAALSAMTSEDVAQMSNPLIQIAGGGLEAQVPRAGEEEGVWSFASGNAACSLTGQSTGNNGVLPDGWAGQAEGALIDCTMSPMSMYNYLNTSFGSTSMETFSPGSTSSAYVRVNHASVSSVGAGPAGVLYFFSAMTVLGSFVIIGFLYAMGLMFSSIKRAFALIGAALGSAAGLLSAIAKVAVLTAALFIELFATLFLYKLVQEFIVIVPTILERPLAQRLSSAPDAGGGVGNSGTVQMFSNADAEAQWGAAAAAAGAAVSLADQRSLGIVALMITLVTTAALLMFTFMAVKLRRGLLDTIDQGVTNLVNKFTDSQVEGGMAPGQPGAIRQGLSRGGSMAMTSMMMSGMSGGAGGAELAEGATGAASGAGTGGGVAGTGGADGGDETATGGPAGGAPGTGGDGSMKVDPAGQLLDAAGNPVPKPSGGGGAATVNDMVPIDRASGHLMDPGSGQSVVGADGSVLEGSDIAGFDDQGRMLDSDGKVMKDAAGNELSSPAASTSAARLMGDENLARSTMENGLSQPGGQMISPMTGQPISQEAAAAGARGPQAATPVVDATAHKLPGETPVSDGAGGRSLGKTFAMGAGGGIASSVLSGQRKRGDMFGAKGSGGSGGGGGGRQGGGGGGGRGGGGRGGGIPKK